MEFLLLLAVGGALYLFSDWLLRRFEQRAGRNFEHRSLIFFAILLTSALVAFAAIRQFAPG